MGETVTVRVAAICCTQATDAYAGLQTLVEWTELTITGTCSHANMIHHDAVTGDDCQHYGTIEYWECPDCGLNFIDEDATTEAISLQGDLGSHNLTATAAAPATGTEWNSTPLPKSSL